VASDRREYVRDGIKKSACEVREVPAASGGGSIAQDVNEMHQLCRCHILGIGGLITQTQTRDVELQLHDLSAAACRILNSCIGLSTKFQSTVSFFGAYTEVVKLELCLRTELTT
jgi:hypothetical protein